MFKNYWQKKTSKSVNQKVELLLMTKYYALRSEQRAFLFDSVITTGFHSLQQNTYFNVNSWLIENKLKLSYRRRNYDAV